MKKLIVILFVFLSYLTNAQMLHPVKWNYKVNEIKEGEAELIFDVKIEKEWHIYSQFTSDGGPLPMLFTFDSAACYSLVGNVSEPKPIEEFDSLFGVKVLYLIKDITLKQKVKYNGKNCRVYGTVSYQACKEACIALDTAFIFNLGKVKKDKSQIPSDSPIQGFNPDENSILFSKELAEKRSDSFLINSSR